jgi:predicted TIM-barrel fold metal-dependent hydrolase
LVNLAYNEAKKLIKQDKKFVDFAINSLLEKKVLFSSDLTFNKTTTVYEEV